MLANHSAVTFDLRSSICEVPLAARLTDVRAAGFDVDGV
jgi:hypothetical protein